jgi:hypothetical protein
MSVVYMCIYNTNLKVYFLSLLLLLLLVVTVLLLPSFCSYLVAAPLKLLAVWLQNTIVHESLHHTNAIMYAALILLPVSCGDYLLGCFSIVKRNHMSCVLHATLCSACSVKRLLQCKGIPLLYFHEV